MCKIQREEQYCSWLTELLNNFGSGCSKVKTKASINAHVCPAALLVTSAIVADGGRRAVAGAWIPVEERKW